MNILILSAGRRVELLRCFRSDAARLGILLRVIAADMKPAWSAACHEADLALAAPPCLHPEYVEFLWDACRRHEVSLVVPTIDTELQVLSDNAERFEGSGVKVSISSPEVVRLARDKLRTAQWLAAAGVPGPRTELASEVLKAPADWSWPVVVKPRAGSSSIGVECVFKPADLVHFAGSEDHVVQERLEGDEYTVNLFFDRSGKLRGAVPHVRHEVRAGEVSKGETKRDVDLQEVAKRLGEHLPGPRGALCFQAMLDHQGRPAVFELNARFGGGYPLTHRAGARFSRWLLEETAGLTSSYADDWRDGVVMLRYDAAVFVEPEPERF
jgi:carbamoyl-phosphate synthase large subunit